MIGHECRLSRTNTNGIVWICQCGEIGGVTPMVGVTEEVTAKGRRRVELTENIARMRHSRHVLAVSDDVARRSDAELARIGKLIPLANATLQRRGRYGHS